MTEPVEIEKVECDICGEGVYDYLMYEDADGNILLTVGTFHGHNVLDTKEVKTKALRDHKIREDAKL